MVWQDFWSWKLAGPVGGGGTSLSLPTEREVVTILHSRSLQEGLQGRTLLGRKLGV